MMSTMFQVLCLLPLLHVPGLQILAGRIHPPLGRAGEASGEGTRQLGRRNMYDLCKRMLGRHFLRFYLYAPDKN